MPTDPTATAATAEHAPGCASERTAWCDCRGMPTPWPVQTTGATVTDRMRCAMCGREKAWPAGFPNRADAICWQCRWDMHNAEQHPPKRRLRWRWPLYREEAHRA